MASILRTSSLVARVPIIVHDCEWCEGLRELLLALGPIPTCLCVAVDHLFFDNRQQDWVRLGWNLSTDELVHVCQVDLGLQPEQEMCMWKPSLKLKVGIWLLS